MSSSRLRILVVDDNEDAGDMLQAALVAFGYDVEVARDGPSAIVMVERFQPDVALLDIGLPGMDGHALARRLSEPGPSTPVRLIALTGYGDNQDRVRSVAAGFEEHLTKPINLAALRAILDRSGT
jgi:CheY-like chemotaxis protein